MPRFWRLLFLVELPLVGGTVLFALVAPAEFAREAFGIGALDGPETTLLFSYVSVVATAVLWFYARLLLGRDIHIPTFRRYQEALLAGDVGIVAIWSWALSAGTVGGAAPVAGLALALFWGLVRLVFLFRVRG